MSKTTKDAYYSKPKHNVKETPKKLREVLTDNTVTESSGTQMQLQSKAFKKGALSQVETNATTSEFTMVDYDLSNLTQEFSISSSFVSGISFEQNLNEANHRNFMKEIPTRQNGVCQLPDISEYSIRNINKGRDFETVNFLARCFPSKVNKLKLSTSELTCINNYMVSVSNLQSKVENPILKAIGNTTDGVEMNGFILHDNVFCHLFNSAADCQTVKFTGCQIQKKNDQIEVSFQTSFPFCITEVILNGTKANEEVNSEDNCELLLAIFVALSKAKFEPGLQRVEAIGCGVDPSVVKKMADDILPNVKVVSAKKSYYMDGSATPTERSTTATEASSHHASPSKDEEDKTIEPSDSRLNPETLKKDSSWKEQKFPSGNHYFGQFNAEDKAHGQGVCLFTDGARYEGDFYCNTCHGKGTKVFSNGNKYVGEWKNGKYDGKGTRTQPDGRTYTGDWQNDMKHGIGEESWPNGSTYRGEYKEGNRHGYAEEVWKDGQIYKGQWEDDKRKGFGAMVFKDGDQYIGQWDDNKPQGEGLKITKSGDINKENRTGNDQAEVAQKLLLLMNLFAN